MRYETVLVATDFSESANAAVDTAVDLARHFDAQLVLLHAYNVEIPIVPAIRRREFRPEVYFGQIGEEARARVEEAVRQIREMGVRAVGVALDEPAALAIVGEAERRGVDVIVLGTRGLTGLKHVALGSVADRVIRMASCPVMTVSGAN